MGGAGEPRGPRGDRRRARGGNFNARGTRNGGQLRAKWLGGVLTKTRYQAYRKKLASFRETSPFEFRDLSGAVFRRAIEQHLAGKWHCRSLDRLHVAAMDELGQRRLLTNDAKQAAAARALGYEIVSPGMGFPGRNH